MTRILVVDDDPDARHILQTVLEAYHFQVATAANGQEAIERIKANVPDGVFLDVRMPVMGGFEALDVLRRDHPGLTIIVTSASMTSPVAEEVRARGADGHLPKPFELSQLRAVLQEFFGWRR